ncbi:MAG: hypothetical protein J6D47_08920 [Peptostreptococcaceae bacterium]|nr:hypothetical protein [Peptostreptococcaceae bacterium]
MNLLELKEKVKKGIELGAEVVYIKEENLLFGLQSAIDDNEKLVFIKEKNDDVKTFDFINTNYFTNMIDDIYEKRGNIDVYIGEDASYRGDDKPIKFLEFAQFPDNDNIKMLFLNI